MIEISLKNKNKCNILFISSIVGGRGFDELSAYAVSKAGLEGFMKSAAIEYAKNDIQINCQLLVYRIFLCREIQKKQERFIWLDHITDAYGRWGSVRVAELASFWYHLKIHI